MEADIIIAIIVAIIAFVALGVTLWQLWVQRKHNRKSVMPYLVFNRITNYDSPQIIIELKNIGLGPAIIKDVSYYIDKKIIKTSDMCNWSNFLKKVGIYPLDVVENTLSNYAISTGDTEVVVSAVILADNSSVQKGHKDLMKNVQRIDIKIRYESIYNDSFEAVLNDEQ
jgi:hypothetical protein